MALVMTIVVEEGRNKTRIIAFFSFSPQNWNNFASILNFVYPQLLEVQDTLISPWSQWAPEVQKGLVSRLSSCGVTVKYKVSTGLLLSLTLSSPLPRQTGCHPPSLPTTHTHSVFTVRGPLPQILPTPTTSYCWQVSSQEQAKGA